MSMYTPTVPSQSSTQRCHGSNKHAGSDHPDAEGDIEYCVSETDEDLLQILQLQQDNHSVGLSREELQSEGFVSAQHDLETLRKMHQDFPHVLAKTTVEGESRVIGYALCMMRNAEQHIAILSGLFSTIDASHYEGKLLSETNYFVMGQVCIAKPFRGGKYGVFGGMYRHMRAVMAPSFEYIVTSIATRNPRSLRAHEKVGFQVIHSYSSFGEDWNIVLWDWRDPITTESKNQYSEAVINFTVAQSDEDLQRILKLQADNHLDSLSSAEMESQGFVSAKHDIETLKIMQTPFPHVIAKATIDGTNTRKDIVVGYTLAMLQSHEPLIPMAKGICARINAAEYRGMSMRSWNYCIMGQVCIHKEYRGKGVFRRLYEQTKAVMSPHFDCIVSAISTKNQRSLRAHAKIGFETICEFRSAGQDWEIVVWDWNPRSQ
jgi:RimJ/RimL family protein N-acetyltransferase